MSYNYKTMVNGHSVMLNIMKISLSNGVYHYTVDILRFSLILPIDILLLLRNMHDIQTKYGIAVVLFVRLVCEALLVSP